MQKSKKSVKGARVADTGNAIVVATIAVCFMITLALCYMFSGEGFMQAFAKKESVSFYAVCTGNYQNMTLARSSAELIKMRGGAGYIISGGENIELVVAIYPGAELAERVRGTLGDNSAYVKEFKISNGSFKWCKKEQKPPMDLALKYFSVCFDKLYNISNDYADNKLGIQDVKNQIDILYQQISDIKSAFYQNVTNTDSDEVTELKLALVTAGALINNIVYGDNVAKTVSSIRYQIMQLVRCHQALMNKI